MKKKPLKSGKRPKMQILESAFNEIISTIGSRRAESGGLLFGFESDMVVRKFVFDSQAQTTSSTYTLNTDFLNPEIRRIWNESGYSVIGFGHTHPPGYVGLSQADIEYFTSMSKAMPRKFYLTPIVLTVPDGGFRLIPYILPMGSREPVKADIEVLPDDFSENEVVIEEKSRPQHKSKNVETLSKFDKIVIVVWTCWFFILAFGLMWFLFKTLYSITNFLNSI